MQSIITVTVNPALDRSAVVDHVIADRKLRCSAPDRDPGGGGINVSRALHRLGGQSQAIYTAGGATGEQLSELLSEEGIIGQRVTVRGTTRDNLTILERVSGQQYRFNMPGPELEPAEWQACLTCLEEAEPAPAYIIASGSLPPGVPEDLYARVAQIGAKRGSRVVIDTSGTPLRLALTAQYGVYLLKPNLSELKDLVGYQSETESSQEEAARSLITQECCQVVVVSLGAGGALLVTRDQTRRYPTPAVPIRSRIGAGDSMTAGMIWGLVQGMELDQAVRFGVATGAATVMTPGTQLCQRAEVERLYHQMESSAAEQQPRIWSQ